jgi:hypothetical protein
MIKYIALNAVRFFAEDCLILPKPFLRGARLL